MTPAKRPGPDTSRVEVDPAELMQFQDELTVHMERLRREGSAPPGAFALFDHFLRMLDRARIGTADRYEIELMIEASNQIAAWRESNGEDSARYAEIREHTRDVLDRLAASVPDRHARPGNPDEGAWSVEAIMMTVTAFAHAIGKSSRTVYRMAREGQLSVYRDGSGRGTMLIYRDQVNPANRPNRPRT